MSIGSSATLITSPKETSQKSIVCATLIVCDAFALAMAERALSPADYAMVVVKGDDKVEKFFPVAVPLGFAAAGALHGAGFRFRDDEGKFNMNFGGNAKAVDPLTGGMIAEKDLGDSTRAKFLGAGIGALQGLNPLTYLRPLAYAGRGAKALRARRAAGALEAGDTAADAYRATELADVNRAIEAAQAQRQANVGSMYDAIDAMPAGGADDAYRFVGGGVEASDATRFADELLAPPVPGTRAFHEATSAAGKQTGTAADMVQDINYLADLERRAAMNAAMRGDTALAGVEGVGRAADVLSRPHLPYTMAPTFAGRVNRAQQYNQLSRAQQMAIAARQGARVGQGAAIGTQMYGNLLPAIAPAVAPESGAPVNIPTQGASGSALGQGGMGNMAGARHGVNPEQQIWSGQLEAQRNQQQPKPIATGEYMTLGDRLLKEAQERMDKAHCGTMKAEDCPGCPKCEGDNKKKAKKPAHGMVIVIGSKAGPGPSKDGKREKLDSDKDDKKE